MRAHAIAEDIETYVVDVRDGKLLALLEDAGPAQLV
jgi:hypothetical protein